MPENIPPRHPLFDPASMYSRMRKSVRPEYKMRGYFHWQKARAIRLGIPLPERAELRQRELRDLACRMARMSGEVWTLAVLPDGRLASGGEDGRVRAWDPMTDQSLALREHQSGVRALAVLPDGRLASGGYDGAVRVWDPNTDEPVTLREHEFGVYALVALPDGRLASGGLDGAVRVWDLKTDEPLALRGHEDGVWALAVLPDGRLASGGGDGTIRVWDLKTDEPLTLRGHQSSVKALAVLPDGRLASGGADGTVRVWDLKIDQFLALRGHDDAVHALAVLPDGRLVSGGFDGTVRMWDPGSGTSHIIGEHGPDFRVTDAVAIRPVCFPRGTRCSGAADGSVVLVREADGTRTVGLWVGGFATIVRDPVSCRAFLIEPEVLARLQDVVQQTAGVGPDNALDHAFAAETVAGNRDVARLLSAIPDLDGEVVRHETRFHRLPIADEFDTFPPRQAPLTVVLVSNAPG